MFISIFMEDVNPLHSGQRAPCDLVLTLALEHCSRVLNRQNLITITSQSGEPDYQMSLMMLTNLEQAQWEQRERTRSVDNIRNSPNNAVSCSR